jgi:hypothetical protein
MYQRVQNTSHLGTTHVEPDTGRDAQPISVDSIADSGNLISMQWGIGIATPLVILGGMLGAAAVAILHYSFDAYLNGKPVGGFWNQLTTRRFENALATVFALLFSMSAGVSLCQLVCDISCFDFSFLY